jgi:hypothetical protein
VTARFEKKNCRRSAKLPGIRMSLIVYMYTGKTLNVFWFLFYFYFFKGFILCKSYSTLLHIFVLSCTELRYSCRLHVYVGSAVYPRNDRPGFVPFRLAYEFTQIIGGRNLLSASVCVRFSFFSNSPPHYME